MKKNVLTDGDSWLNRGLSRLFDILLFGIITMILCLPVITIGAAITANMDVYMQCALKKDGKLFRRYFKAFAKNFLKATLIWIILLIVGLLIGGLVIISLGDYAQLSEGMKTFITIFSLIMALLYCLTFAYVFTLQGRYENPIGTTIINALIIGVTNFPRSIFMVALTAAMVALGYFLPGVIPLCVLLEFSFINYFSAKLIVPVLAKLGDKEAAGEYVEEEELPEAEEVTEEAPEEEKNDKKEKRAKGLKTNPKSENKMHNDAK